MGLNPFWAGASIMGALFAGRIRIENLIQPNPERVMKNWIWTNSKNPWDY